MVDVNTPGVFAYLSTIKDACTKQILAYVLSSNTVEDFALETTGTR